MQIDHSSNLNYLQKLPKLKKYFVYTIAYVEYNIKQVKKKE